MVYRSSSLFHTLHCYSSLCRRNLEGACWTTWSISLQVAFDWIHEQDLSPKYRRAVSVSLRRICVLFVHSEGECALLSPAVGSVQSSGEFFFFFFGIQTKATVPFTPVQYTIPPNPLSLAPFSSCLISPKIHFDRPSFLSLIPVSMPNNRQILPYCTDTISILILPHCIH